MENLQCGNGFLILLHLIIFTIIMEIRPQSQKHSFFFYIGPRSKKKGLKLTTNQKRRTRIPQFLAY